MSATLTPNYIVGKAVAVSVAGTLVYCTDGNTERTAAAVKVTNSRSAGFMQVKAGIKGATGTLNLVYNGDDPPTGIVEGAEVTLILDFVGYETSESIEVAASTPTGRLITMQALITSVKDTWNVEDNYSWSIDVQSSGAYTVVETATGASAIT